MSKTIKEWFESIEDIEIRNRALVNMDEKDRDRKVYSFKEAIRGGFDWQPTPEGYEYWDKISQGGLNDSIQPRSPYPVNPDHYKNAIKMADTPKQHTYDLKIYNGRVKVYVDGYVMFTFNQIDFSGYYAFKDDSSLFGITIYMNREKASPQEMDIYFKTKENWLNILKLLDERL
jgi:hypothetical protein